MNKRNQMAKMNDKMCRLTLYVLNPASYRASKESQTLADTLWKRVWDLQACKKPDNVLGTTVFQPSFFRIGNTLELTTGNKTGVGGLVYPKFMSSEQPAQMPYQVLDGSLEQTFPVCSDVLPSCIDSELACFLCLWHLQCSEGEPAGDRLLTTLWRAVSVLL